MHTLRRQANILGSLSLSVGDQVRSASEGQIGSGGEAPAGLVAIATFLSGASIEELSRALGLSHSAVVRLVDKLEGQGLVSRRSGSDRRSVAIVATYLGNQLADRVLAARSRALAELLSALDESERAELTRLHEKLLSGLVRGGARTTQICRLCDADGCGHYAGLCPVTEAARAMRSDRRQH